MQTSIHGTIGTYFRNIKSESGKIIQKAIKKRLMIGFKVLYRKKLQNMKMTQLNVVKFKD